MTQSQVEVATDPPYTVRMGPGAARGWAALCAGADRIALVADRRAFKLQGAALGPIGELPQRLLPAGEASKTWEELGQTLEFLSHAGLSRRSVVLAFGGGAACDHAGLAASLYKRGCAVVHVPTTLLSQVDASVGGKTAVNLAAGKNLAGTFHQPRGVLVDSDVLATLPDDELRSGLGEVLKTALLDGDDTLRFVEEAADALRAADSLAMAGAVARCVAAKARIVAADPHEAGLRRVLNLGHTFGHSIELCAGYGAIPHGVAVAAGIGLALRTGVERGTTASEVLRRTAALAKRLGLPASLGDLRASTGLELPADELAAGLAHDKKGSFGAPEFILLHDVGRAEAGIALAPELLAKLFA